MVRGSQLFQFDAYCWFAGKLVLGQPVPGSGGSPGGISCSAMAVSNNLLFVADNKGIIYTLRCNIKNGILQVTPHTVTAQVRHSF